MPSEELLAFVKKERDELDDYLGLIEKVDDLPVAPRLTRAYFVLATVGAIQEHTGRPTGKDELTDVLQDVVSNRIKVGVGLDELAIGNPHTTRSLISRLHDELYEMRLIDISVNGATTITDAGMIALAGVMQPVANPYHETAVANL